MKAAGRPKSAPLSHPAANNPSREVTEQSRLIYVDPASRVRMQGEFSPLSMDRLVRLSVYDDFTADVLANR